MKEKNNLRKWLLPIGAVAMASLPLVSVISCSNSSTTPETPDNGGNPGDGGNGNGGGGQTPQPTKELIEYSSNFEYIGNSMFNRHDANLLVNFDKWKNKILNNQVKWFNEDGSAITYELNLHLDAGLVSGDSQYVDVSHPPYADKNNPLGRDNQYKTIKNAIDLKWQFYKKEDNNSFTWYDFVSDVKTNVPYKLDGASYDNVSSNVTAAFPLDSTIACANATGKDLANSTIKYIHYFGIETRKDGKIILGSVYDGKPKNWNSIKNKFNPINSFENNLWVEGLKESQDNGIFDGEAGYFNKVKGTISIKKVDK